MLAIRFFECLDICLWQFSSVGRVFRLVIERFLTRSQPPSTQHSTDAKLLGAESRYEAPLQ